MASPSPKTLLSRLHVQERQQPLFVFTTFNEKSLSVKVSDGACTWQGTLCAEQLEMLAELSKMSLGSFLDETMKALSGMDEPSFVYSVMSDEAGELEFAWKKLSDGIKFQLGSINLLPVHNQLVNGLLLNFSLDCVNSLESKIKALEEKCKRLTNERQTALDHLQTCSALRETIESELHGKFKLILNEKKAKIRKLMESKSYLVEQNEEMKRQIWDTKTGPFKSVEGELVKEKDERSRQTETKARSPSKFATDVESLLCDAASKPPSPPPTKRRQLNRGVRKGKVEIPLPPPLDLHSNKVQNIDANKKKNTELSLDSNELLDML